MNHLYYGDNLDVLRRHISGESVDLIYLDPPFNSNATYNVLFGHQDGTRAAAQIKAFEDTWRWDQAAAEAYQEVVELGGQVSDAMRAFRTLLGPSNMLAYLAMMAHRLIELRRVLKPTGSLYLHCDPTASHGLKLVMDTIFGTKNFRNEIVWRRTGAHGRARRWGPIHDTILFYSASDQYTWNRVCQDYDPGYIENFYRFSDKHGRYRHVTLDGPGERTGSSGETWRGVNPGNAGRHWEVPPDRALPDWFRFPDGYSDMTCQERLDVLDDQGLIYWPKKGSKPQYKRYLMEGNSIQDIIYDIRPIGSSAKERLGYPTQKPVALLERIIEASSNPGDLVLDPFCGCGTAVAAAQQLNREWIGIDITHLAINLIRHRLIDSYGPEMEDTFTVTGEPVSLRGAAELARSDPYQFQFWALGMVGARPVEEKRGADQGIDGQLLFHEGRTAADTKQVVISVKAGRTGPAHVRDLRGVVDRENAVIGVLISMQKPTQKMREEAASAGFYESPWAKHPRLQLLTIEELLQGGRIDYPSTPGTNVTYKRAPRKEKQTAEQLRLGEGE